MYAKQFHDRLKGLGVLVGAFWVSVAAPAAALALFRVAPAAALAAGVPAPPRMPADVIVSGRTSTARKVATAAVGKQIPETFSGDKVKNTPGFSWYVSRHYALKTDYKPDRAREYLALLEMAYPHYVELFGAEPKGIGEKRMAVVYASGVPQLRKALASDGIRWDFSGGGITFEGYRCAYQYPSGSLEYHRRYILLHEGAHLYQMCLNGTLLNTSEWFYEGLADLLASHVYRRGAGRLTVRVLDKATTHNHLDQGLRDYRRTRPRFSRLHAAGGVSRGLGFLMAAFFLTDPDRSQRFRIYRDEMFRLSPRGDAVAETSSRLLVGLFGGWDGLDSAFERWVSARRSTFHYVEWGWEQDGRTLWSYGFAPGGKLSRTNVNLPPGRLDGPDPLRTDYPPAEAQPLVGRVRRGGAEPAVGAIIDFSKNPRKGSAGIALGLVDSPPIAPLAPESLFRDEAGKKPGINVAAYRKGIVIDGGRRSKDVSSGPLIGRGAEAGIALGARGSVTGGLTSGFVVEWDGWLKIDRPGRRRFVLASDDGSWLWIDGKLLVDNGGLHQERSRSADVHLSGGMHRLRVRYFQMYGPASLKLGVRTEEKPGSLKILIRAGRELVVDGSEAGIGTKTSPLPEALVEAMSAGGHRVGLNARIAAEALVVTLRARGDDDDAAAKFQLSVPLIAGVRRRLLDRGGAVLARGGYHGVTPFFDERPGARAADLSVPAPPNRWRNPGDKRLHRLYRACWRLGEKAPASLSALKADMLAAADADPAEQKRALAGLAGRLPAVIKDVEACGAPPPRVAEALAELKAPARP